MSRWWRGWYPDPIELVPDEEEETRTLAGTGGPHEEKEQTATHTPRRQASGGTAPPIPDLGLQRPAWRQCLWLTVPSVVFVTAA